MRAWDNFTTNQTTSGHIVRFLPRDFKIFRELEPGWEYPEIWNHVENKIATWLETRRAVGLSSDMSDPDVADYIKDWRIPYDPTKFPNKWWVLEPDKPVRTVLAHLGKDSYSHIHFDAAQARTISLREAARLQSFPDGYRFEGSMNQALRQIGNAVPPLLAYALAVGIRESLGVTVADDMRVKYLEIEPKTVCVVEGLPTDK